MSDPNNRLDKFSTYSTTFILSAWADTSSAENDANAPKLTDGPEGKSLPGNGVLILNDAFGKGTNRFVGKRLQYDYSWTGTETSNTAAIGEFILHDVSGGDFFGFLRNNVVSLLKTSIENISFRLDVYFHFPDTEGKIERCEPLIFVINDFKFLFMNGYNQYTLSLMACHNTIGNATKFTRLYDMTVTHKDGQLHEETPTPNPSGGSIKPRGEEDGEKIGPREERLEKSKPMTTLQDAFEALEIELNESTKIHKNQLQSWQAIIRDDFVSKLQVPSIQEKELDIKFKIHLDPKYKDFPINNRTIPWEQPELNANDEGIRTIPSKSGETFLELIDRIMKMSRDVGIDSKKGYTHKICPIWRKKGNTLLYDVVIKRYEVPINFAVGKNTGSGESAKAPITFFYKDDKNRDVRALSGMSCRTDMVDIVEDVIDNVPGRVVYGGEREPITGERERDRKFFETGYSGFRAKIANYKTLAVEYPKELAESMKKQYNMQSLQQSTFVINIHGNIDLFNDTMRKPSETVSSSHPKSVHYKLPEILPWYAKLLIFLNTNYEDIGGPEPELFYHKEWMHIMRISTVIESSHFHQTLTLARSDDIV